MVKEFNTGIITTDDQHVILCYVEKHLKQGIWKNAKTMARYRNSLRFRDKDRQDNEQLVLIDHHDQCKTSLSEFFADMIKWIIEAELEDDRHAKKLEWSHDCLVRSKYFCGEVTVRDCYEFYEILKNCDRADYQKSAIENTDEDVMKGFSAMTIQLAPDEMRAEFEKADRAEKASERRFKNLFKSTASH